MKLTHMRLAKIAEQTQPDELSGNPFETLAEPDEPRTEPCAEPPALKYHDLRPHMCAADGLFLCS